MEKLLRTGLALAAAVAIWPALWAQQPQPQAQDQPVTVEHRLEEAEKRLALLEKALETSAGAPARLPDAALETRLGRLESRVDRLEGQAARQPVGTASSSYDRMLESRVRMLEQQVARLRR